MSECVLLPFDPHDGPRATPAPRPDLWAALVDKEHAVETWRREAAAREYLLKCADRQRKAAAADVARREATEQTLRAELAAYVQVEQALRAELAALTGSDGWRVLQRLRRWRLAVAPPGSLRERALVLTKRAARVWRRQGLCALATKAVRKTGAKGFRAGRRVLGIGPTTRHGPDGPAEPAPAAVLMTWTHQAVRETSIPNPQASAAGGETTVGYGSSIPPMPALDEILALTPRHAGVPDAAVDVIVRAGGGLGETLGCLRRLLTVPTAAAYEIVVLGDAGLDPVLIQCLHAIAAAGLVTFLDDPTGEGEGLRRALALHPGRDVVLLDVDAVVCGDWVDRLRAAAYATRDAGTVAPLTNAATPCGYPFVEADKAGAAVYRLPDDLTPDALDRLCATLNPGQSVELPAAAGPCLYVRRDCLAAVGPPEQPPAVANSLDTHEFSRRVRAAGWRHLAAVDTFVFQGDRNAGASSPAPFRAGLPADDPLAIAHRMADPALPCRRRIDLSRLVGPEPAMLYVTHHRGGGTERHVRDMATRLEHEGVRVIVLRPLGGGAVFLERLGRAGLPNLVYTLPGEYWTLRQALQTLRIGHVHVHHPIDVPAGVFDLIGDLGLPYDWTVHDYYTVCPLVNLLDDRGVYCGEPGPARCNVCLEASPHFEGPADVLAWRAAHRARLAGARKVFVPDEDVAARLTRYFPEVAFTVRPHFEADDRFRPVAVPWSPPEPLRVALIGHFTRHKGAAILVACAQDALARRLPLHFCMVGHTDHDALLRGLPNVSITGPYQEAEVFRLLEGRRCHCAFFPAVWPETFSYTLSVALRAGLFPVAFDLGAPAARLRALGTGHLIPLTTRADVINRELLGLAPRLTRLPSDGPKGFGEYASLLADYYGLIGQNPHTAARPVAAGV